MKNVLFPIDFSCNTESVIKKAIEIIPELENIYFLYVVPLSVKELEDFVTEDYIKSSKEIAENKMKSFIRNLNLPNKFKIDYAITDGDPARVIIDLANSGKFDAIVLGHRGYSYIEDFFIGSVTLKVISKVNIPVVVIKKTKKKGECE
ncbi:MAG: universal stress protein [Thermoplasmata archaeon]|jgi:nucleotide-binding universal stress UspA family protein